jgi:hypothetical protein
LRRRQLLSQRHELPLSENDMQRSFRVWVSVSLLMPSLAARALVSGANAGGSNNGQLANAGSGSSGPVGASALSADLFTGTASMSIPIDAPAGRHGVQPQVTVTYRSGNPNGLAGVGWDLELGAIERRTKGGLDYSGDKYVLKSAGGMADLVHDLSANIYRLQIEGTFSRIRWLTATDGSIYWELTDKLGTRYLYGETNQSREYDPATPGHIFRWALDFVEDTRGNCISLFYTTDGNKLYPREIDYTGHLTPGSTVDLNPSNSIIFQWGARPDATSGYKANFLQQMNLRLQQIAVSGGGQTIRSYQFAYTASAATGRSLLASVTNYGKDGVTTLPATSFQWTAQQLPSPTFSYAATNTPFGSWTGLSMIRPADVNGDGSDDVVLGPDTSGNYSLLEGSQWGLTYKGLFATGSHGSWANDDTARSHVFVGDVNGDGKQDLILGRRKSLDR